MSLHVLHVVSGVSRRSGGLGPAVMESVSEQRRQGLDARVVTLAEAYTAEDAEPFGVPVEALPGGWPGALGYSRALWPHLLAGPPPDVVHSHGMWQYPGYVAMRLGERLGLPSVVSPHGMLEPWARRQRRCRKTAAWWLWERRRLQRAAAVVATSDLEAEHLRGLGVAAPVAVIPLGLHLPEIAGPKPENDPRVALFLSRLHPKKGLLMLVEAVARLRPVGWHFVIAGPSEGGHGEVVQAAVRAAGLEGVFSFPGAVYGGDKWRLYRSADLFILPTHSENFGLVVAEALAAELPVLTTRGTPWHTLLEHGCGWWVAPTVDGITTGLSAALAAETGALREMGRRGRALVAREYTWEVAATRTVELYRWLAGQQAQPAFVR